MLKSHFVKPHPFRTHEESFSIEGLIGLLGFRSPFDRIVMHVVVVVAVDDGRRHLAVGMVGNLKTKGPHSGPWWQQHSMARSV